MKTPDEIKRGLEWCNSCGRVIAGCSKGCPYWDAKYGCGNDYLMGDALAYIQQLERERDMLIEGLKTELGCYVCKHFDNDAEYVSNDCMNCGKKKRNWEWRGVEEDDQ